METKPQTLVQAVSISIQIKLLWKTKNKQTGSFLEFEQSSM